VVSCEPCRQYLLPPIRFRDFVADQLSDPGSFIPIQDHGERAAYQVEGMAKLNITEFAKLFL
jgi:hypothetical protein